MSEKLIRVVVFDKYFIANVKMLTGLYFAFNDTADKNIKLFEIKDMRPIQNTRITKYSDTVIITMWPEKDIIIQYLIGSDLDIKELDTLPENVWIPGIKELIINNIGLTGNTTLADLL